MNKSAIKEDQKLADQQTSGPIGRRNIASKDRISSDQLSANELRSQLDRSVPGTGAGKLGTGLFAAISRSSLKSSRQQKSFEIDKVARGYRAVEKKEKSTGFLKVWSLPEMLTAIGVVVAIVSLFFTIVYQIQDRLDQKIDQVEQKLTTRMNELEQNLTTKIDTVDARLSGDIKSVNEGLNRIDANINRTNGMLEILVGKGLKK